MGGFLVGKKHCESSILNKPSWMVHFSFISFWPIVNCSLHNTCGHRHHNNAGVDYKWVGH